MSYKLPVFGSYNSKIISILIEYWNERIKRKSLLINDIMKLIVELKSLNIIKRSKNFINKN